MLRGLRSAPACWALAAGFLSWTVQQGDGMYLRGGRADWLGFVWLTLALISVAMSLRFMVQARPASAPSNLPGNLQPNGSDHRSPALRWILAALIAFHFVQFYAYPLPGSSWTSGPQVWRGWARIDWLFYALLTSAFAACAILVVAALKNKERFVRRIAFPLALLTFLALGVWILKTVPRPEMDVWWAQQSGLEALRHGQNPYTASFPDIHQNPAIYAPGMVKDGRVQMGFPYPPVVLWMDLPGHLRAGDYRYSNLAAMALAALLIAYLRPGVIGPLAALLLLFTPRVLFVLESGWTEPLSALLLAALVWGAIKKTWWAPAVLGIFLASKQYNVMIVPCALLLIDRPWKWPNVVRWIGLAAIAGAVTSLPVVLWDVNAFLHSAVGQAGASPLRTDAMSYLALFNVHTGFTPPLWLGFAAGLTAAAWTLWRLRPGATAFTISIVTVLLLFFALGKFAFCNYYYFLIAALCVAVGASDCPSKTHSAPTESRGKENQAVC